MTYQKHISQGGADWTNNTFLFAEDLQNIESGIQTICSKINSKRIFINSLVEAMDIDLGKPEFYNILGYKENTIFRLIHVLETLTKIREENRLTKQKYVTKNAGFTTWILGRKEVGACLVDKTLFWGGGFYAGYSASSGQFFKIELLSKDFKHEIETMPKTGGAFELIHYQGTIFRTPLLHVYPDTFEDYVRTFDIKTQSWKDYLDTGHQRYRAAYEQVEDLLFCFGGHNQYLQSQTDCYLFDLKDKTFETLTSLPTALASGQTARIDDSIWLINGWHWDSDSGYKGVLRYDIYDDSWETVRSFAHDLKLHKMCRFGDQIFIWGGDNTSNQVNLYDPISDQMSASTKDIFGSGLVRWQNRLFSVTGGTSTGETQSLEEINRNHFLLGVIYADASVSRFRYPGIGLKEYYYFNKTGTNWSRINLLTREVETLSNLPFSGDQIGFCSYGRFIYAVHEGQIKVYDTKNDTWNDTQFGTIPNLLDYSFLQMGRLAYFMGGDESVNGISFGCLDLQNETFLGSSSLASHSGEPIINLAMFHAYYYIYGGGGYKTVSGTLSDELFLGYISTLNIWAFDHWFASPLRKYSIKIRGMRDRTMFFGGESGSPNSFSPTLMDPETQTVLDQVVSSSFNWARPISVSSTHLFNGTAYFLASAADSNILFIGTIYLNEDFRSNRVFQI